MIPGYPLVDARSVRSNTIYELVIYHGVDKQSPGWHHIFTPSRRFTHEIVSPPDLGKFTQVRMPGEQMLHTDCETVFDPTNIVMVSWKMALPMNMRMSHDMRMFKATNGPAFREETIDQIQRIIDRYKLLLAHFKGKVI